MATKRTEGQASLLLAKYEERNKDLPKETRQQLAIFALVHRVGIHALEALFGQKLGQTPYRHRSWFWWNALRTSDLAEYWSGFVTRRNDGLSFDKCLAWLKDKSIQYQWDTLARRLGKDALYPSDYQHKERDTPANIWTKGGVWERGNGFTEIIIEGEHLDRDYSYNSMTERLGPEGASQLERELANLIDPDKELEPHAKWRAVQYVRHRLPRIAGWRDQKPHLLTVSWFFQSPIPRSQNSKDFYDWRWRKGPRRRLKHGRARYWAWLPGEHDE